MRNCFRFYKKTCQVFHLDILLVWPLQHLKQTTYCNFKKPFHEILMQAKTERRSRYVTCHGSKRQVDTRPSTGVKQQELPRHYFNIPYIGYF